MYQRGEGVPQDDVSAEVLGIEAKAPAGGISTDLLRQVHVAQYRM